MTSFVRGGTISSAYQRELDQKKANADERRKAEDKRQAIAAKDPNNSRYSNTRLGGTKSHAAIVLTLRNNDHVVDYIMCELSADSSDPTGHGLMLTVCCPGCAKRVGSAEAQMTIRSNHRHFELDTRRQGELWVNPADPQEFVHLAGTIQLTEAVTCPGLGCGWRFKIDDSIVKTITPPATTR